MDRKLSMKLAGRNLPTRIREQLSERNLYRDWNQHCEMIALQVAEFQDFRQAAKFISHSVYSFLKDYGYFKPKSSGYEAREWLVDTRALILWEEEFVNRSGLSVNNAKGIYE